MPTTSIAESSHTVEYAAATHAAAHAEYQLRNTPSRVWPYQHTLVRPVLPKSYYEQLLASFPADELFVPLNEYHPDRGALFLTPDRESGTDDLTLLSESQRPFWLGFLKAFSSDRFRAALLGSLGGPELVRTHLEITRPLIHLSLDRKGYQIRPHTDIAKKIVTVLFYLPDQHDETLASFGTSVLAQREGNEHLDPHDWGRYDSVFTAPFLANTMFAFRVGPASWHGVHPVDRPIRRRSIQYFLILDE